jgi:hypothetical protein
LSVPGVLFDPTSGLLAAFAAIAQAEGGAIGRTTFARRPVRLKGNESPLGLYAAVGTALSAWEAFEHELGELFDAVLFPEHSPRAGLTAFIAMTGFEGRRRVVESILDNCLPENAEKLDIVALLGCAEEGARRRNDIAHGIVLQVDGFILVPNVLAGRRKWPKGTAAYQWIAEDVENYGTLFLWLHAETVRLREGIQANAAEISEYRAVRWGRPQPHID